MPIKIPDVPADGVDHPFSPSEGTQTRMMLHATLGAILQYQGEIEDELGPNFKLEIMTTNRVLLTTADEQQQVICYMSDRHADARLVMDDYVPEVQEGP